MRILNLTLHLQLIFADNPKAYLVEQLQKLQKAKTTQMDFPILFDDSNIKSIFGMLDPTQRGFITFNQYKEGRWKN